MPFAPEISGPHDPVVTTPPRRAGSVRRTTTIDTHRPDGIAGPAVTDARARDLRTDRSGDATVLGAQQLHIAFGPTKVIAAIDAPGTDVDLDALVGVDPMVGLRKVLATHLPGEVAGATLLHALLDDLVGASLVSGTALQHHETVNGEGAMSDLLRRSIGSMLERQVGICAGWADDASMVVEIRRVGTVPTPLGPIAPTIERADDPIGWHDGSTLAPHSTRRRRRIDVGPVIDGLAAFDAHFRDTHVAGDGVERIVHEYTITGGVDVASGTLASVVATVQVLPWLECPQAIASATRADGVRVDALRAFVRTDLRGTSTCTHLNDTIRSLGDLAALLPHLDRG